MILIPLSFLDHENEPILAIASVANQKCKKKVHVFLNIAILLYLIANSQMLTSTIKAKYHFAGAWDIVF